jgi:putative glutamine amidotransferase
MIYPLIGVTTFQTESQSGLSLVSVTRKYVEAVVNAGGNPVLIPLGLIDEALSELLPRLDGLLLTGGGDVQPQRYGSQPHPLVNNVNIERDEMEACLVQQAAYHGLPFLGICRGLQVINVALGGTLYEDLLAQHPGAQHHDYSDDFPRQHIAHSVKIVAESRLGRILGRSKAGVNSLHHQGIRQLSPGLKAVAHANDGVIEAVELCGDLANHPFGLAVQWHPEWMDDYPAMQSLFKTFIQACCG